MNQSIHQIRSNRINQFQSINESTINQSSIGGGLAAGGEALRIILGPPDGTRGRGLRSQYNMPWQTYLDTSQILLYWPMSRNPTFIYYVLKFRPGPGPGQARARASAGPGLEPPGPSRVQARAKARAWPGPGPSSIPKNPFSKKTHVFRPATSFPKKKQII